MSQRQLSYNITLLHKMQEKFSHNFKIFYPQTPKASLLPPKSLDAARLEPYN